MRSSTGLSSDVQDNLKRVSPSNQAWEPPLWKRKKFIPPRKLQEKLDKVSKQTQPPSRKLTLPSQPPAPAPAPAPWISQAKWISYYEYGNDDEEYKVADQGLRLHLMTRKEELKYSRQVEESDGFDVQSFKHSVAFALIQPIYNMNSVATQLKAYSELAIEEYNQKHNTKLQFVRVLKANGELVAGRMYYITFEVQDTAAPINKKDADAYIFQAKVWDKIIGSAVQLCRPKPSQ